MLKPECANERPAQPHREVVAESEGSDEARDERHSRVAPGAAGNRYAWRRTHRARMLSASVCPGGTGSMTTAMGSTEIGRGTPMNRLCRPMRNTSACGRAGSIALPFSPVIHQPAARPPPALFSPARNRSRSKAEPIPAMSLPPTYQAADSHGADHSTSVGWDAHAPGAAERGRLRDAGTAEARELARGCAPADVRSARGDSKLTVEAAGAQSRPSHPSLRAASTTFWRFFCHTSSGVRPSSKGCRVRNQWSRSQPL